MEETTNTAVEQEQTSDSFMEGWDDEPAADAADQPEEATEEMTPAAEPENQSETATDTEAETTAQEQADTSGQTQQQETPPADAPKVWTLRHMDEVKQVGEADMVILAQKGMDYDRVTEKNTQLENQVSEQKQQLAQLTEHENALQELAKQSGTTVEELVENMLIAVTKSKYGIDDDGMALERVKLDRERRALDQERAALATKNQEQEQQAENEKWRGECFDAFAKAYPDVDPASIPNGVWEAFNRGETLVSAYARERNKALEAEIARMKSEQETRDRNAANAARSTGSQSSAGKTGSDEAFDALWYDGN